MKKQTISLLLALSLLIPALAGCRASGPDPAETTVPVTTEAIREDSRLTDFAQRLRSQGAASLEEFCANYEEARGLYLDGFRPAAAVPVYDPTQEESAPGDFYWVSLDPGVYGVSKFFVLPAGERALTAEEYLELVEAAEAITAQDLVLADHSWLSTQSGRENPLASRLLYRSESFWLSYLLGMYYQGQELPAESRTVSALYLPLPVEDAVYTLLPTDHMTPRGLLEYGLHSLEQAPESRRAKYIPPEDTDYETLRSAAAQAVLEHTDLTEAPTAVYYSFTDTTSPGSDARSYSWTVGLLYSDGASYTVRLDGPDRALMTIERLPDGALDLTGSWYDLDAPQLEHDYIYNG